jgi:hypothetical protein
VPYHTGPPQQADIEGARMKKGTAGKEERYLHDKVAIYEREEVGIDDEDEELMDEGNNVRYLRLN